MSILPEPQDDMPSRSRRNKILKKGVVTFSHQESTRTCSVHEISETGALLRFEDETGIPASFVLHVELDGINVPCKCVRRVGNKIAVTFTGEIEQVKIVRKQVVQPDYEPTKILRDREAELNQIIANMRNGNSANNSPQAADTVRPAKKVTKSFGTRK